MNKKKLIDIDKNIKLKESFKKKEIEIQRTIRNNTGIVIRRSRDRAKRNRIRRMIQNKTIIITRRSSDHTRRNRRQRTIRNNTSIVIQRTKYAQHNFFVKEVDILNKIPITLAKRLLENKNKEVKTSTSPGIYYYLELKKNWSQSILDIKMNRLPIYSKEELVEIRKLEYRRWQNNGRSYSIRKLELI